MARLLIIHDFMKVNGGAERLVCQISNAYPNSSVLVGGVGENFKSLPKNIRVIENILFNRLPYQISALLKFLAMYYSPINKSTIIYSGIYSVFAFSSSKNVNKLYYCHTLPKFAFENKLKFSKKYNFILRPIVHLIVYMYKILYIKTIKSMDCVMCNSLFTANKIKTYCNIDPIVVHPPIDTNGFKWISNGDFFLSLSRLERYKRVDIVLDAFADMPNKKLVVASGGTLFKEFKHKYGKFKNIIFTNWLDNYQLQHLLGTCLATIYLPFEEDFGMSAVESLSAGKPVIAAKSGGLIEILEDNKNGYFLGEPVSSFGLKSLITSLDSTCYREKKIYCESSADKYSKEIFINKIRYLIKKYENPAHL